MLTEKSSSIQRFANRFNADKWYFYLIRCIGPGAFLLYLFLYAMNLLDSIINKTVPYWIDPVGWAELTAVSGFTGLLFSWLLNWLHETECDVRMSEIFSYKYKPYVKNIIFFLVSTSICVYYSRTKAASTIGGLAIIIFNSFSMAAELFYIGSMCWGFLFNMDSRKKNTYLYLQNKIMSDWSATKYLEWNTPETICVIREFSCSANWAFYNLSQWFFHMWSIRLSMLMKGDGNDVPQVAQGAAQTQWERETKDMLDTVLRYNSDDMAKEILGNLLYAFALDYGIIDKSDDYLTDDVRKTYKVSTVSPEYLRISYVSQLTMWALYLFNKDRNDGNEHKVDDVFRQFYMAVRHVHMLLKNLDGKNNNGIDCTIDYSKFRTLSQTAMFTCAAALSIDQGEARQEDFALKCAVKRYNDYLDVMVFSSLNEGVVCGGPYSLDLFTEISHIVSIYNLRPVSTRENPELVKAFQIVKGWFIPPEKPFPREPAGCNGSTEERRSEVHV